ncbi:hypothetical protein HLH33_19945 [Gluconacetobacter diazotrophicus]|uniref:Uncharacterized protein n=1 Tax=Gluconacetobacter diazotrophicus TaxID=33996 RepID=A0A7W4I916_GLUDI|nr:hypothetical protein [Gluconacetobacter diazotrophicus]MBB2158522.1 hypothetical protein [Gluconacetobacter diazotrophicus]
MAVLEDVTNVLKGILSDHPAVEETLTMILSSPLLGRETISAALGELSEHLIAKAIGGARIARGNRGFDLIGPSEERIEVKSRQIGRWGDTLQFNFSKHTEQAHTVYCIAWDNTEEGDRPSLRAAYRIDVPELLRRWGTPNQSSYAARTNLGLLKKAFA